MRLREPGGERRRRRPALRAPASACALALVLAASSAPVAASVFDPASSTLELYVVHGAQPPITITGTGGDARVVGPATLTDSSGVWQTTGSVSAATFPLVANLSRIQFTIGNASGVFTTGFSTPNPVGTLPLAGLGGVAPVTGDLLLSALLFVRYTIPLDAVGLGGTSTFKPNVGYVLEITAGPFVTGPAQVTGVTAITPGGQLVETVTRSGGITRGGMPISFAQVGEGTSTYIQLVAPFRFQTGNIIDLGPDQAAVVAGFAVKTFHFVPEPASCVLMGASLAGLAALSRRRRGR